MSKLHDEVRKYLRKRQKKAAKTLQERYGKDYFKKIAQKSRKKAIKTVVHT
jgi:hypothetical protein